MPLKSSDARSALWPRRVGHCFGFIRRCAPNMIGLRFVHRRRRLRIPGLRPISCAEAECLIRENLGVVTALVDAIVERGTMTGDEIGAQTR